MPLYSTGQAAKLAGISPGSIRNIVSGMFSAHYTGLFSAGARPGKGAPRVFTPEDVKLLAFIRAQTETGISHAEVARRITAGELETFTWSPPAVAESAAPPQDAPQEATAGPHAPQEAGAGTFALALASQWASLLESARAREVDLQDRLIEAQTRAARAEGELEAIKAAQKRGFFRRLFGA
jgi:DNA-binding transcriptional MerR regulator